MIVGQWEPTPWIVARARAKTGCSQTPTGHELAFNGNGRVSTVGAQSARHAKYYCRLGEVEMASPARMDGPFLLGTGGVNSGRFYGG